MRDFVVVFHGGICSEHSQMKRRNCLMTEAANSFSAAAGPEQRQLGVLSPNYLRMRPRRDSLEFGSACCGAPVPQNGIRRRGDDCITPRHVQGRL